MKNRSLPIFGLLALACSLAPATAAEQPKPLAESTRKNLESAMHGEAFANLKYLQFAERARMGGNEKLALLFEESANVEANEHFAREADALGLVADNATNLADAVAGEHYESTKMYVEFAEQADKAGDRKVAELFRQIAIDEDDHYRQYKDAAEQLHAAATAGN